MIFVLMIVTIGVTTISCSFDKWPDEVYTEDSTHRTDGDDDGGDDNTPDDDTGTDDNTPDDGGGTDDNTPDDGDTGTDDGDTTPQESTIRLNYRISAYNSDDVELIGVVHKGPDTPFSITIPATVVIDGHQYNVTMPSVGFGMVDGTNWFIHQYLTRVVIADGVGRKRIGDSFFAGCTALESVTISNIVTEIGEYAFSNCTSLRSINLPERLETIEPMTFKNCASLTTISFPTVVNTISEQAFYGCDLRKIIIPDNVKHIGDYAFAGCKHLQMVEIRGSLEAYATLFSNTNNSFYILSNSFYPAILSQGEASDREYVGVVCYAPDQQVDLYEKRNNRGYLSWEDFGVIIMPISLYTPPTR